MKRFFSLCITILAVIQNSHSQDLFSAMRATVEGGRVSPMGDLSLKAESAYYGNMGVAYPYAPHLEGYALGGYAYVPVSSPAFAGLHQLSGRAGIELSPSWLAPLSVGGGISMIFVRGDSIAPEAKEYFLYDNESEFGWHARLTMPVIRQPSWRMGFRANWEEIWTLPAKSQFFWLGLYVEIDP